MWYVGVAMQKRGGALAAVAHRREASNSIKTSPN